MKIKTGRAGLIAVVLAALVGCGARAAEVSKDATEAEQTSAPASAVQSPAQARLSSGALQSRWWTWALSEPEGTNPVADEDGSECGRNQPQDVWFLAGAFGTQAKRTCSVPDGVPLAFPLVNLIAGQADCTDFMSAANGSAVLDGERVDSETIRGETITVRGVADNPVTGTDERFRATGCGLWVQLPPLQPGKHTLTIRGQSEDFAVGVDYSLTVDAA
ncbi:signal protein [Streptomyces acidicola]|uniref:Signal protein n=1 Tax=Streptomyces acidicola TaxID=2596892 RepID=A0A5N8X1K0_9ACTN|nr:signal protein [Streptomyces acidicola]MPY52345.1 signal protein [Streptomyces acidicola]